MSLDSHKQFATGAALVMAACLTVGCGKRQDQAGWWQDEQQRIELSQQLELKQYRFELASSRDFEQLESLRQSTKGNAALLKSLDMQCRALANRIELLVNEWAEFRESTIREQRQVAMGKTFGKLTVNSGRTFVDVSVASINDSGVSIRHADGSARLRFADLDARQRDFFGLEPQRAAAAEEQEARDAAAYESWIEKQMVALEEKKLKDAENGRQEELAAHQIRAAVAAQLASVSVARTLARPAKSVRGRSWNYSSKYSTYRASRPIYRYVYYYNTPSIICQHAAYGSCPGGVTASHVYTPRFVPHY